MAYSTGMLKDRILIYKKAANVDTKYGRNSGGVSYEVISGFWANVTWTKGVKAMREGALDAYDTIMVRMRWHPYINYDCIIVHDDKAYAITSLHQSKSENTIQMVCVEKPDFKIG